MNLRHLLNIFEYTFWRHERIVKHLQKMPDQRQFTQKELSCLFFGTPQATLYHLLIGDELWRLRLTGQWENNSRYRELCKYWSDSSLVRKDAHKIGDLDSYLKIQRKNLNEYGKIVKNIKDTQIEHKDISYDDTSGRTHTKKVYDVFYHVNNHHTHHLGQLSAAYRQHTGKNDFPELDYTYFKV